MHLGASGTLTCALAVMLNVADCCGGSRSADLRLCLLSFAAAARCSSLSRASACKCHFSQYTLSHVCCLVIADSVPP